MLIRELESHDEDALRRFLDAIPPGDRTFFKEDVADPAVLRRWIDDARGVRLVAIEDDGAMAAVAAVWPGVGRSAHVGDLRLFVTAEHRREGLGRQLARAALGSALRLGMWKISVEVVATQQGTIDMFLALGFTGEALLRDQLWTRGEDPEDVVLLSHLADDAAQSVLLAAPDEAVA